MPKHPNLCTYGGHSYSKHHPEQFKVPVPTGLGDPQLAGGVRKWGGQAWEENGFCLQLDDPGQFTPNLASAFSSEKWDFFHISSSCLNVSIACVAAMERGEVWTGGIPVGELASL